MKAMRMHRDGSRHPSGRKVLKIRPSSDSKSLGHMPRLDTIQMVEEVIRSDRIFTSKNLLWRSLPKQVQYPTFMRILDYLKNSNKIIYDKDGTIVWTFVDSPEAKKSLEDSTSL